MFTRSFLLLVACVLSVAASALAGPLPVGSGQNTASLVINFKDGAAYEFAVSFDIPPTGIALLDIVESHTSLTTQRSVFDFGTFIDGFTFDNHSNIGYGDGEDWWQYWTRDSASDPWKSSAIGPSDRILFSGAADGWVYGRATAPVVPEPTSLALLAASCLLLRRRRDSHPAPTIPRLAIVPLASLAALLTSPAFAYVFNPSDFATQVVDYTPGTGLVRDYLSGEAFENPANALGRPTVDTTSDGFNIPPNEIVPVVPIYGPFRSFELVTVGQGGHLTVAFDHPVTNDPNNPFGFDFIIFGNAAGNSDDYWANRDPASLNMRTGLRSEKGIVSVSQDGQTWHTFPNGPFADTFAPTLGRVYDSADPDVSIGSWNRWWGQPTDPTLPLDPSITQDSLADQSIASIAQLYGVSAGGTGLDIGQLGLPWVQYVRIDNPDGSNATPDIDAFADVAPIPEPASIALLTVAVALLSRRRTAIPD